MTQKEKELLNKKIEDFKMLPIDKKIEISTFLKTLENLDKSANILNSNGKSYLKNMLLIINYVFNEINENEKKN